MVPLSFLIHSKAWWAHFWARALKPVGIRRGASSIMPWRRTLLRSCSRRTACPRGALSRWSTWPGSTPAACRHAPGSPLAALLACASHTIPAHQDWPVPSAQRWDEPVPGPTCLHQGHAALVVLHMAQLMCIPEPRTSVVALSQWLT